jgi:hypothetical protein
VTEERDTQEIRRVEGKFAKGVSGNPSGRPKNSKNKLTLLRQSLELQLREQVAPFMPDIIAKAAEMAKKGDRSMIKLLTELHMSKSAPEATEAREKLEIHISSDAPTNVNSSKVIEAEEAEIYENES